MILLSDYMTVRGDQSVLPGLRRLALAAVNGQSLIADGPRWTDKDRASVYQKLTEAKLLMRCGFWLPIARERAAAELDKRKGVSVPAIIAKPTGGPKE